jgi:hypothetical protein
MFLFYFLHFSFNISFNILTISMPRSKPYPRGFINFVKLNTLFLFQYIYGKTVRNNGRNLVVKKRDRNLVI